MRLKVQLEGYENGLKKLSESFDEDPRIFEEDEKYYLWSSRFEELDESGKVQDRGDTIVRMVRHLGELDSIRVKDLDASCVVEIQEDGSERRIVNESVSITATASVSVRDSVGGEEPPPKAESTYEFTQLALKDDKVQELIELWDNGEHWVNLYRIYEYIDSNVEPGDIVAQDWWTDAEDSRFTCTANDPDAIGHEARHAGDSSDASVEQMSHNQMGHEKAKSIINDLIEHWLKHRMEINSVK